MIAHDFKVGDRVEITAAAAKRLLARGAISNHEFARLTN